MVFIQKFIRNEAMKVDPVEIYSWRVLALACTACFGGFLFGMDIGTIGGVITMDTFKQAFGLPKNDKVLAANISANIVTVMQLGAFAGALIAIPIADKLGRKPAMYVVSILTIIGVIFQAASSGYFAVMYIGRFISGLGLGAATMVTPTYVSENAPRGIRGALTGLYQLFETGGAMIAFWIDFGSLLNSRGNAQWVVPLALQALPAALLSVGMFFCTESPRFLAMKDDWGEALRVLCKIRRLPSDHAYIQAELKEMQVQLETEHSIAGGRTPKNIVRELLTVPANRKRAIISIGMMVAQQLTGTNAVNFYAPAIFSSLGVTGNAQSLFATGVYGICKVVGCAVFLVFMADTWGRKKSLMLSSSIMAVAMFYLGFYVRFDPPDPSKPLPKAGIAGLVAVYVYAVAFQLGWGPVCWIYASEIPTARLRSVNISLAASTQWLWNFAIARATPVMLITVGADGYGTYFLFACFNVAMTVVVAFVLPETKGLSLERMDELFGAADFKGVEDVGVAAQHARQEKERTAHVEHQESTN